MKTVAVLFVLCLSAAFGAGTNFPTERTWLSPDFRWSIRCVSEEEGGGYLHKLYLSRFLGTDERLIYASGRNCDVLWADDGKRLAITDWSGSSASEVYLVDLSQTGQALQLDVKNVAKFVTRPELKGHCYYEAVKWEDALHIQICISGHTDENPSHGFGYFLLVDTSSGDGKLVMKVDTGTIRPGQAGLHPILRTVVWGDLV